MYKVYLCGLSYAGYKGGRRRWSDPASGKVLSSKDAARLAASLRAQGLPVSIKGAGRHRPGAV